MLLLLRGAEGPETSFLLRCMNFFPSSHSPSTPQHSMGLTETSILQVQTGGSFDVDYSVVGPNERTIMEGSKERQGDFVFTAKEPGEYRFCFNNEMSTWVEKMVDFEIAVRTLGLEHKILDLLTSAVLNTLYSIVPLFDPESEAD